MQRTRMHGRERVGRVPDVALADEHARVVDGLGQAQLEHQRLQPALQEVLHSASAACCKVSATQHTM